MATYDYRCPLCQNVFSGPWLRPMDPTVCPQCEEEGQRIARELLGGNGSRRLPRAQGERSLAVQRAQRLHRISSVA